MLTGRRRTGPMRRGRLAAASGGALLLLAACGGQAPTDTPSASSPSPSAADPTPVASPSPSAGAVEPAPGSDSALYPPNPAAIVVAIDAGHGGCLDWGVPDPSRRGNRYAEETMTLEIARLVRDRLQADGVTVLMIRDEDESLAGDDYPPLDCHGPGWRDANGDGHVGFGDDELPEGTRTRDELQARLDVANLARADALVSIHINSPSEGGQVVEIAFSQTFYTDETPWGPDASAELAQGVQDGVVAALEPLVDYERGDRGIAAQNFYMVAPTLFETTDDRPDPLKQPTRGGLMPVVLSEVGSISLRAEHDLLVAEAGQAAVADGIVRGVAGFLAGRPLAARIGPEGEPVGAAPEAVPGDGPPYWASQAAGGPMELRITNTGTDAWAAGSRLVAGWEPTDGPYLPRAPEALEPIGPPLPALEPGASVVVRVELPPAPDAARAVAWISLVVDDVRLDLRGSPPLQLSSAAP
jgi:N-acetylmuramoyl-L-alanine amidase